MKKNRIEEGRFSANARGLGTVTREMVLRRAREIAEINGRPDNVLETHFQEAHRELTTEDMDQPKVSAEELVPEDKRWMEVPENEGKKVGPVPAPDEQTFAEKLVEEGVEDAEHDQMTRATREAARRDNE